jgi:hypothetical protein
MKSRVDLEKKGGALTANATIGHQKNGFRRWQVNLPVTDHPHDKS